MSNSTFINYIFSDTTFMDFHDISKANILNCTFIIFAKVLYSLFSQIEDLKKIHNVICLDHVQNEDIIQLSLDGVMESKSSFNSLDTYSVKFDKCRNIYPIRIIKPCEKFKFDDQEQLSHVLEDINDNNLTIECLVLDNPKRSDVRCAKCSSAKFACEYCENSAISYVDSKKKSLTLIRKRYDLQERNISQEIEQIQQTQTQSDNDDDDDDYQDELLLNLRETLATVIEERESELRKNGRKKITWPASTMGGNLRTVDAIKEISNEIENNPNIVKSDPEFCKGIKGKSLMLDQPSFDLTKDMPCEYMHLVCLGVVKRMIELNFKVGENRDRQTKRKLSSPHCSMNLLN